MTTPPPLAVCAGAPWLPPLLLWVVAASLLAFFIMGFDKRRARRGGRRVREVSFFLVAALGGAPGAIWGMYAYRHKTRHWYFKWGLPAILVAQTVLVLCLLRL